MRRVAALQFGGESTKVICAADRKRSLAGNGGSVTAPPTLTYCRLQYTQSMLDRDIRRALVCYTVYVPGAGVSTATATGAPWPLAQIKQDSSGHYYTIRSIPHAAGRHNWMKGRTERHPII